MRDRNQRWLLFFDFVILVTNFISDIFHQLSAINLETQPDICSLGARFWVASAARMVHVTITTSRSCGFSFRRLRAFSREWSTKRGLFRFFLTFLCGWLARCSPLRFSYRRGGRYWISDTVHHQWLFPFVHALADDTTPVRSKIGRRYLSSSRLL